MKVGILAVGQRPAVFHIVRKMVALGTSPSVIFLDPSPTAQKDRDLWNQRTAGRIPDGSLDELGVPIVSGCGHRDEMFPALVATHGIDLLVNAATPGILKARTLAAAPLGILNVHPGLLPDYRGCTCVEWAIYNDDAVGNSVHFMTEGIDEGPVVATQDYSFTKKDHYVDIRVRVLSSGYDLVAQTASRFIKSGKLASKPQGPGTYHKPIPDDKMAEVLAKLDAGRYRFQL